VSNQNGDAQADHVAKNIDSDGHGHGVYSSGTACRPITSRERGSDRNKFKMKTRALARKRTNFGVILVATCLHNTRVKPVDIRAQFGSCLETRGNLNLRRGIAFSLREWIIHYDMTSHGDIPLLWAE
jgi:hypothetical protein